MKELSATDRATIHRWFNAFSTELRWVERYPEREEKETLYEYYVNHEITIEERSWHICTAHPEARAAARAGHLPVAFACPLADDACPMRRILGAHPGCDVRFSARA